MTDSTSTTTSTVMEYLSSSRLSEGGKMMGTPQRSTGTPRPRAAMGKSTTGSGRNRSDRTLRDEEQAHVEDWRDLAECYDLPYEESFSIPEHEQRAFIRKYCDKCVVTEECLELALKVPDQYGVWGGLTEQERRKLRRYKRRSA